MNVSIKLILLSIIAIVCIVFFLDIARFYLLIRKGKALAYAAVPFQRIIPNAPMKILILGDSLEVGTGAEDPSFSIAGRLGALYPTASIENRAVNGLKLTGLLKILDTIDSKNHYSVILVQIGANDIIYQTKMLDIESGANKVLTRLAPQTDKLILLSSGDVGQARIFPFYLKPLMSKRSFEVRDIYTKLASVYGVTYIDLINSPARKLLNDNPTVYYAQDYLHLNGSGYGLWFDEIKKVLK
ncbi:MAG: GDSL-type esterase/lipase family protein [bacterium]|nr:GDSL-type esterase/lipase family protein [bacterium]